MRSWINIVLPHSLCGGFVYHLRSWLPPLHSTSPLSSPTSPLTPALVDVRFATVGAGLRADDVAQFKAAGKCMHPCTYVCMRVSTAGYRNFHPIAQCVVHALKGLACRARVTLTSSPTSHRKQCSALTSPSLHTRGCARPSRAH